MKHELSNKDYQIVYYVGIKALTISPRPLAGPRSAFGRAPDSYVRGPKLDTRSGHTLLFLLPLIQEGQLAVTGRSICTKYWLTALEV